MHDAMEYFGARPDLPLQTCIDEVRKSDILVVIVGHRYGSMVTGAETSFSEAEYNEGVRLGKPILAYVRDDSVPILVKHVERDSANLERLEKWKRTLVQRHTVATFRESADLALQVAADLSRNVSKIEQEKHERVGGGPLRAAAATNGRVLLSQSDVEDYLHGAVENLANGLVDGDELITGLIAGTNAFGYTADDVEVVEIGTFNFPEASIPFRARVHLTGEQDEDHMFLGNKIFVDISGTFAFDGSDWEIVDHDVAAELEDISE